MGHTKVTRYTGCRPPYTATGRSTDGGCRRAALKAVRDSPSRVRPDPKAVRDTGASLRSIHHDTRAVEGFSRWPWRDGRRGRIPGPT